MGICGTGITNAIALFIKNGLVLPSGTIANGSEIDICKGVYVTQKDIRNFQLAKSAIRTAIDLLMDFAGCDVSAIGHVYLAGGMGSYLNEEAALFLGLLPCELKGKIIPCGNAALHGAVCCLTNEESRTLAKRVTALPHVLELSSYPKFYEEFLKNMEL